MGVCFPSQEHGDIPSDSELLIHLFLVFRIGRSCRLFFLEFSKDGSADLGDEFTDGDSGQLASDTARMCRFLPLPGVSALFQVSIQLLRAS